MSSALRVSWLKKLNNMLTNFVKGNDREEKIDKFLDNLAWFHSEKETPVGIYSTFSRMEEDLNKLNQNIEAANNSSSKLTSALNRITLAGAIIAGLGVVVAALNFIFQYLIK